MKTHFKKHKCQVLGCDVELASEMKKYCLKRRVCPTHLTASSVQLWEHGENMRFCHQCGKFQPLKWFDGEKRSCRVGLLRRRTSEKHVLFSTAEEPCKYLHPFPASCVTCHTSLTDVPGAGCGRGSCSGMNGLCTQQQRAAGHATAHQPCVQLPCPMAAAQPAGTTAGVTYNTTACAGSTAVETALNQQHQFNGSQSAAASTQQLRLPISFNSAAQSLLAGASALQERISDASLDWAYSALEADLACEAPYVQQQYPPPAAATAPALHAVHCQPAVNVVGGCNTDNGSSQSNTSPAPGLIPSAASIPDPVPLRLAPAVAPAVAAAEAVDPASAIDQLLDSLLQEYIAEAMGPQATAAQMSAADSAATAAQQLNTAMAAASNGCQALNSAAAVTGAPLMRLSSESSAVQMPYLTRTAAAGQPAAAVPMQERLIAMQQQLQVMSAQLQQLQQLYYM